MTASEIELLLAMLARGETGSEYLTRWLAEASPWFLRSTGDSDQKVIADLDAALAEVQSSREPEEYLRKVALQLQAILGLEPPVPETVIRYTLGTADVDASTNTTNASGGTTLPARAEESLQYV